MNTALNCTHAYTSQSGNGEVKTVIVSLASGERELQLSLCRDY